MNVPLPDDIRSQLDALSTQVIETINVASKLSETVIITNAEAGWVAESSGRFLPAVHDLIEENIAVYSARSKCEQSHGFNPTVWKKVEFLDQVNERTYSDPLHVISIGDAEFERDAARNLKQYGHTVQTMKLTICPTIQQLTKQLADIAITLERMLKETRSFDVEVSHGSSIKPNAESEKENVAPSNVSPVNADIQATAKKYQHLIPCIPSVTPSIWHDFAAQPGGDWCNPWGDVQKSVMEHPLNHPWSSNEQLAFDNSYVMDMEIPPTVTMFPQDTELFSTREILVAT